jgi:hypothetical protein
MVEVSTDRAVARRTIFCRNVRQNTARIARTIDNVVVCRDFARSVFTIIIINVGDSIARISQIATAHRTIEIGSLAGLLPCI